MGHLIDTARTTSAVRPIHSVGAVMDIAAQPALAPPRKAPPKKVPLALMRTITTMLAVAVFTQPMLAGLFLSGNFDMVAVHGSVAVIIELLALVQVIAAVVLWRPGGGPGWPVFAGLGIFVAVFAQTAAGYIRALAVHIPLGVALAAITFLLLVWVWRPRLGRVKEGGGPP